MGGYKFESKYIYSYSSTPYPTFSVDAALDIIEHQLAHAVKDPTGRAYNRTSHLPQREEIMQSWADYLNELKNDANAENLIQGYFKKQAC